MLNISKHYVLDEQQHPIAVQIPIATFEQIEEVLEDFGLAQLMAEVEGEETLSGDAAYAYYQSLKQE